MLWTPDARHDRKEADCRPKARALPSRRATSPAPWRWAVAGAALWLAGCAAPAASDVHVTLLAFNDFHGRLAPPDGGVPVLQPDGRIATVPAGGAAYLAGLVHRLQATRPHPLVVAAGDLVGASPLASAAFHDEPTIEALGLLGLQVASVGNHEFDHGRDELLRLQRGGCAPAVPGRADRGVVGGDTCLEQGRYAGASFRYLSANVVDATTGEPLFPATALLHAGPATIGFIGLVLAATPTVVTPTGVAGLRFLPEVDVVRHWAPILRQQGADAVVVLIHQGGETTATHADDRSCPGFHGDILPIVDAIGAEVDAVVSGHTHQEYVCTRPGGLLVTSAGSYGRYLTEIDLRIDLGAHRVVGREAVSHVVANGGPLAAGGAVSAALAASAAETVPAPIPPDPAVQALVARTVERTRALEQTPVGPAAGPLRREAGPSGESALGDAVADAYLRATAGLGATIAFTNPGGLRADVQPDPATGYVSYGQLYNALPFGNTLVTMDLTGAQIEALLAEQWQPGQARMLQVSRGFGYRWQAQDGGGRVVPGSIYVHGEPLSPGRSYRVTVNSYMAAGGDGYRVFTSGEQRVEGPVDLDAMVAHVRAGGIADRATGSVPRVARVP